MAVLVLAMIPFAGNYLLEGMQPLSLATADSQSPGIYATAFYSRPADAQVVWLNGLEPASGKPTYLDPTTGISGQSETQQQTRDPNSL